MFFDNLRAVFSDRLRAVSFENMMRTMLHADDVAQLRARLLAVQAGDAGLWGVMTAAEMLCHVGGAFRMAMGELPSAPISLPLPRAVVKAAALWAPVPWPKNVSTVPALRRGTPAMQTGVFAEDREGTLQEMERFCLPEGTRGEHAFFGAMSYADWMRWGYLHTDHHLRQFGR